MFKTINHSSDIELFVRDKKEIRFLTQPNGVTIGCYMFSDSKTFDSIEALECRGIAFDSSGQVVSRPLHKFFNIGEKERLMPDYLVGRDDIAAIYEKLDGSMIATALVEGKLLWRSKKSFESDVVKLAIAFIDLPENENIKIFASIVAKINMTAIFEFMHPETRIVVAQDQPALRLLHVRDNSTGQYVMLNFSHQVHKWITEHRIPTVQSYKNLSIGAALESLANMSGREGYVIQFKNGDMGKLKCPWYLRLHRNITFLRERDIALLALREELDDVKQDLLEIGVDLTEVNKVETRLKDILCALLDEIETIYQRGKDLDRKSFAIANKAHPLFDMAIQRYSGREVSLIDWYERNRLKADFNLRILTNTTLAEVVEE